MDKQETGKLYLVGTPIGNLGDMTIRALETLKSVDIIAAEDTRQTQKLLNHFAIKKPLTSYFEHNKRSKGIEIINQLKLGKNIALVSDAGMPGISDPGSELVLECIKQDIVIIVIPGASALLTGLVASGLDTNAFVYGGFFPRQTKDRKKLLQELSGETRTMIFYESPHRLCSALEEMAAQWGEGRSCCVARELTKVYEEYKRGTLQEVLQYYQEKNIKGEITLIVEGNKQTAVPQPWEETEARVQELIKSGLSKKEAIKLASAGHKVSRREIYNRILKTEKNKTDAD